MLRSFFDEHARSDAGTHEGTHGGTHGAHALPTLSAADALKAMRALGVSPPALPDGRPVHRLPFEVSSLSRVTFAQLCRAVQRSLEAAGARPHVGCRRSFVFEEQVHLPQDVEQQSFSPQMPSHATPPQSPARGKRVHEAPAVLQGGLGLPEGSPRSGARGMRPCATEPSLEALGAQWHEKRPLLCGPVRASPSQQVDALVERRFVYLGREAR